LNLSIKIKVCLLQTTFVIVLEFMESLELLGIVTYQFICY